jgi:suppressor of G2 allele of SKP1
VSQFPSSFSKGKNTNWEQIEREAEKEEEENLTGDAKLNKLFQQIYRDADEDTRRAMEKSYIESNGTSLSTNWEEVKQGKVETKPPDGTPIGYLWHALALFSMSA